MNRSSPSVSLSPMNDPVAEKNPWIVPRMLLALAAICVRAMAKFRFMICQAVAKSSCMIACQMASVSCLKAGESVRAMAIPPTIAVPTPTIASVTGLKSAGSALRSENAVTRPDRANEATFVASPNANRNPAAPATACERIGNRCAKPLTIFRNAVSPCSTDEITPLSPPATESDIRSSAAFRRRIAPVIPLMRSSNASALVIDLPI